MLGISSNTGVPSYGAQAPPVKGLLTYLKQCFHNIIEVNGVIFFIERQQYLLTRLINFEAEFATATLIPCICCTVCNAELLANSWVHPPACKQL